MGEGLTVRLSAPLAGVRVIGHTPPSRAQRWGQAGPGPRGASAAGDEQLIARMQQELDKEKAELAGARQALVEALNQFNRHREQLLRGAENQLLDLAVEIARKVLMQEIQAERHQIEPIVTEALQNLPARQEVVVHLNPRDLAKCEIARQADDAEEPGNIRFVADPSVSPAQCVLVTPEGIVDSNVDTHLQAVSEALKQPE